MSLFDRRPTYTAKIPLLVSSMTITGATLLGIGFWVLLALAFNVVVVLALGWLFQMFWAWYVPALSAAIPLLDYWHSVATVVIILVFLHHLKGHEPKK